MKTLLALSEQKAHIVNNKGLADIIYGKDVSNLSIQRDILGSKSLSNINESSF